MPAHWRVARLSGAALIALAAVVPVLMSGVMYRSFEVVKLSALAPLALMALGAAAFAPIESGRKQWFGAVEVAGIALLVFLLIAGTGTALSETPAVAFFGNYFRREGLMAWVSYGALFLALRLWAQEESRATGFLDTMLVTSAIPAVYALLQRFGLDFYSTSGFEAALPRPGGSLGNSLFLGAYLAMLLPLALVKAVQTRRRLAPCVAWVSLAGTQALALVFTLSRGPLIAVMAGSALLACLAAARWRRRVVLLCAAGSIVVCAAGVGAINFIPSLGKLASENPVLGRLVYSPDKNLSYASYGASRNIATRLGVWQAGMATLGAAPLQQQLIGYGPESAYQHYLAHIPPLVMQFEGYWESNTFDRLHSDILDITLNFGILGWLVYCLFFCAVIYTGAKTLFGLSGGAAAWVFVAVSFWSGVVASVLSIVLGFSGAAWPAFALGLAGGWCLFLIGCAWRSLALRTAPPRGAEPRHWGLVAGLTCALIIFWFDAQVNIPVIATRVISFSCAALLLVLSSGVTPADDGDRPDLPRADYLDYLMWGLCFALVAACASFLPPVLEGSGIPQLGLRLLPMAAMILIMGLLLWSGWNQTSAGAGLRLLCSLATALAIPAAFALAQYAAAVNLADRRASCRERV